MEVNNSDFMRLKIVTKQSEKRICLIQYDELSVRLGRAFKYLSYPIG